MTMHTSPTEILDRFADSTFDITDEITASYWHLDDGSVFESREYRPTTRVIFRRHHSANSTVAACL